MKLKEESLILNEYSFQAKDIPEQIFLALSNKKKDKIEIIPIKDKPGRRFGHIKPSGGMWGSMPTKNNQYISDWHEWAIKEDFCVNKLQNVMEFTLNPNAKVLRIKNIKDLEIVATDFPVDKSLELIDMKEYYGFNCSVSWETISKYFDAVIVTEHISIWDVPSICIFNPDAIESFKNYTIEEYAEINQKDLSIHNKALNK